jgi:hypothetical protein
VLIVATDVLLLPQVTADVQLLVEVSEYVQVAVNWIAPPTSIVVDIGVIAMLTSVGGGLPSTAPIVNG